MGNIFLLFIVFLLVTQLIENHFNRKRIELYKNAYKDRHEMCHRLLVKIAAMEANHG